ncbi:hypothetical protein EHQ68_06815 [Leptospira congkakensis]|uniref:Uncharacterized protein n=1 Tax=Leptospira congkakensis TaxID=2484932 RepID=A0A4Z1A8Q8_9LEPT|nr:hypothetical protein [Leptospira congkakensis]TGL87676.1 hypothetical protein EHQ69_16345 [Leptospira congkakensis]TGL89708.1 hypothetical protein EHQ68_06815 [Leptospira congkakensis]TGL95826.1 hypothetical protein EHQ70_12015 [Leptospira congkakensis]
MNILDALKQHKPRDLGKFSVEIKFTNNKAVKFSGRFTQDGPSIYAHYDAMNLVGGSQDSDEQSAKIKSIMRLVSLIELRLLFFKKLGDYERLFYDSVSQEDKDNFVSFADTLRWDDHYDNDELIPVETESLEKTEDGFIYKRVHIDKVSDLSHIQTLESDLMNQKKIDTTQVILEEKLIGQNFTLQTV